MHEDLTFVIVMTIICVVALILSSIYIFRQKTSKDSNLTHAFKNDLDKSGKFANPIDLPDRVKYMFNNPDNKNELYFRRFRDFSGNINTKTGLIILLTALIIFIVGILGYTFLFYKI